MSFTEFILENRIKVNKYLNRVLWFFVITGPAIALGLHGGIFRDITQRTGLTEGPVPGEAWGWLWVMGAYPLRRYFGVHVVDCHPGFIRQSTAS